MRLLYSRHLEHFLAICEAGSLRRAATQCGVTQPALTKSLKLLESAFGVSLFERAPDGMVPTPAAHILRRHALQIVNSARYIEMEIGMLRGGEGGTLRIGAGIVWSATRAPALVAALRQDFPRLTLTVRVGVADDLLPRLLDGELDIVVASLSQQPLPAGYTTIELPATQMMIFARAAHPLVNRRRPVTLNELSKAEVVGFVDDTAWQRQTKAMFAAHGYSVPTMRLQSSSLETLLAAVGESDSVTFLAELLAPQAKAHGLKRIPTAQDLWAIRLGVSYRTQLAEFAPLNALLAAVRGDETSGRGGRSRQ
ncbi:MAG: LysR family transcriptional regulator [Burkholderiales bacterium]|nr:LysR family transcriptional regulator [Burkholderiales bacterium]